MKKTKFVKVVKDRNTKSYTLSNGTLLRINPELPKVQIDAIIKWADKYAEWSLSIDDGHRLADLRRTAMKEFDKKLLNDKPYSAELKAYKKARKAELKIYKDQHPLYEEATELKKLITASGDNYITL